MKVAGENGESDRWNRWKWPVKPVKTGENGESGRWRPVTVTDDDR